MDAKITGYILDELCVKLGLCIGKEKTSRLIENHADTPELLADQVLIAEGLDPNSHKHLREQACEVIRRHLQISN